MTQQDTRSEFNARLLRPKGSGSGSAWAFVILPYEASAKLPRRGRVTVMATINGHGFQALLEPDGQKSHWLRIDEDLLEASQARIGEEAHFEIAAVEQEPEPEVPAWRPPPNPWLRGIQQRQSHASTGFIGLRRRNWQKHA